MEDGFEIPVTYKGTEHMIAARLLMQGYAYKIEAVVEEQTIYFEPDEERSFRAILPQDDAGTSKHPPVALLQAIAEALTEILK